MKQEQNSTPPFYRLQVTCKASENLVCAAERLLNLNLFCFSITSDPSAMAARSRRRSWQFLLILAVLTVLASSRAVNQRRRQSDESSDGFGYHGRVSNGQDDVGNADFLPSDSKNSQSGINPLLDLSGLGDTSAFDVEDGELGGPFPKSLNDFYKGFQRCASP